MRIFDETKTYELDKKTLDFEKGYLKPDKIVAAHHEATPLIKGKIAKQIAEELEAQGVVIEEGYGGLIYRVVKEYEDGGRDTELIEDKPDIPAKEAYDEYEDIQVYVLYNAEQLNNMLRAKRASILNAFDTYKSNVEYGIEKETETEHNNIIAWYKDLLDLKESAFENIPERIKYYL